MLSVYIILGHFPSIFRENYVFYVIVYTLFPILCFGMVFYVFCRFLDHFTPDLILNECVWTPHRCPWVAMPVQRKKNRKMSSQWTSLSARGGCHSSWCLYFLWVSLFSHGFLTSKQLLMPFILVAVRLPTALLQKGALILISTHHPISIPFPFYLDYKLF